MRDAAALRTDLKSESPTKGRRWARISARAAWLVTIGAYIGFVFAYAYPPDFGSTSVPHVFVSWLGVVVRTMAFHLGLLLAVVGVLAAIRRRWGLVLALAPICVFSLASQDPRWSRPPAREIDGEPVTVMTLNLMKANTDAAAVVAEVEHVDPGILLFQEHTDRWWGLLQTKLSSRFPHVHHWPARGARGVAIYSHYPFVGEVDGNLPLCDRPGSQLRAVVQIGEHEVAVYNIHMLPPSRPPKCIARRQQFTHLLQHISAETRPVILAGDFNFAGNTPYTDALKRVGLIDVHKFQGRGRGATWPTYGPSAWIPGWRIDHIFVSEELASGGSRVGGLVGSDHRPVIAEIGLASTP